MNDRALSIFLKIVFGLGGIAILTLSWTQSMPLFERVLTTSIGTAGILYTSIGLLTMMFVSGRAGITRRALKVEVNSETRDL